MRIGVSGSGRSRLAAAVAGTAVAGAAVLAPAALTGTARAATTPAVVHLDKACYVITKTVPMMTVEGSGFVPTAPGATGTPVSITDMTGSVDKTVTPDAAGNFTATMRAPVTNFEAPGQKKDTITAEQITPTGEIKGAAPTFISALGAEHGSTKKLPGLRALSEKTKWSFSGFPVGKTIWGHYTIKGKQVARQSFGRTTKPCGVLTSTRKLFPGKPKHESYPLQLDTVKKFSKKTTPAIRGLKVSLELQF